MIDNNNNPNTSFITEDIGAKDNDEENREPFSEIPTKPNNEKNQKLFKVVQKVLDSGDQTIHYQEWCLIVRHVSDILMEVLTVILVTSDFRIQSNLFRQEQLCAFRFRDYFQRKTQISKLPEVIIYNYQVGTYLCKSSA